MEELFNGQLSFADIEAENAFRFVGLMLIVA